MFQKIRKNIEFLNVYRHGKSYANKYLVMYVLSNKLDENRFGITVSKKVGNVTVNSRGTATVNLGHGLTYRKSIKKKKK